MRGILLPFRPNLPMHVCLQILTMQSGGQLPGNSYGQTTGVRNKFPSALCGCY